MKKSTYKDQLYFYTLTINNTKANLRKQFHSREKITKTKNKSEKSIL